MSRIEILAEHYKNHISAPWQTNLAGPQKAIFIVYPKTDERRLRARMGLFEIATQEANKKWKVMDITTTFANWMTGIDYREIYFEEPADLALKLSTEFVLYAAERIRDVLTADDVDDDTVVGVYGVASLFGFARISLILKEIECDIKGRLVLFFSGEYENGNYRLLDARDGWNYLAVPITLHDGGE